MRFIYSTLLYLAAPWLFLRLLLRSRRTPELRKHWAERLGFCPYQFDQCIWVHAVSVGETIAAIPLIKALKKQYPDIPLLVTNMTATGSARVKAALGDTVFNAYIPYDWPDAVSRFLARIQPKIAIIMETELWPNLFAQCQQRHIPMMIANARLSEKSAQGYQRVASLTRDMLTAVTILAVQAKPDADRFVALGMPKDRVNIIGNIKFDMELPQDLQTKQIALRKQLGSERLIWIAASTHPGEEEIILAAHRLIKEKFPQALLILVPRHPERFDSIAELITQNNFRVARRSRNEICNVGVDVYLADTMGEMMLMYAVCDVAFVGGSFASIGGHNMLEPAALHKPIIVGPQLFNFAEISAMLFTANGMIKVENTDQLVQTVSALFSDKNKRDMLGENAFQVVEKNRGALKRHLDLIESIIS